MEELKVTEPPAHIELPGLALIEIVGVAAGIVDVVIVLDVTVVVVRQEALLVMLHFTSAPLEKPLAVNVLPVTPVTTAPPTIH
jgi:hypothetical protein